MGISQEPIKSPERGRFRRSLLLLIVPLAIITTYYHHHVFISRPNLLAIAQNHIQVISGEAQAPTQYRVAPFRIAEEIYRIAIYFGAEEEAGTLILCYTGISLVLTAVSFSLLIVFLQRWFSPGKAVLGLLFMVAVNPLAEYMYFHQPSDPWILMFFLLGYIAIVYQKDIWLPLIVFLAVPFKETIGLLIPAYIAAGLGKTTPKHTIWIAVLMTIGFILPYLYLRLLYGSLENYMEDRLLKVDMPSIFMVNLTNLDGWIVLLLLFNALWIAVPLMWRKLPRDIRRMFFMVPIFFLIHLFNGRFVEARLFLPLLPLYIPAGILWLDLLYRKDT